MIPELPPELRTVVARKARFSDDFMSLRLANTKNFTR